MSGANLYACGTKMLLSSTVCEETQEPAGITGRVKCWHSKEDQRNIAFRRTPCLRLSFVIVLQLKHKRASSFRSVAASSIGVAGTEKMVSDLRNTLVFDRPTLRAIADLASSQLVSSSLASPALEAVAPVWTGRLR